MFRDCVLLLAFLAFEPLALSAQTKPAPAVKPVATTPEPATRIPPDIQVATVHATGGTSTLSTVQLKGGRARISVGDNLASIQQCDARQTIQLNTQARTYLSLPFESTSHAMRSMWPTTPKLSSPLPSATSQFEAGTSMLPWVREVTRKPATGHPELRPTYPADWFLDSGTP